LRLDVRRRGEGAFAFRPGAAFFDGCQPDNANPEKRHRTQMVHSQTEAKRLFVEKVAIQARLEGILLSDAERKMLSWSESDPDFVIDPQLPEHLASEMSDTEYEKKVAGLLARRFAAEVAVDPAAEAQWKQAAEVLHQGDHYILIMLDEALRSRLKLWPQCWR
jgi:hypothetical protein